MIYCPTCDKDKPEEDFYPSVRNRQVACCKKCRSLQSSQNRNPMGERKRRLKNTYNITEEELLQLAEKQEYKCAICKKKISIISSSKGLVIDHCHKTGKVRGLLCYSCNTLIGLAKENPEILKSAINYVSNTTI